MDECVEAGQLIRGYTAELRGWNLLDKKDVTAAQESIPFMVVTDAKDAYDKVVSDKNTLGTRRSLAMTLAWLKQQFRGRNIKARWTDASNMLTDPLTKDMNASHLVKMLDRETWAVTYNQDFVKAKIRARGTPVTAPVSREQLPGVAALEPELAFIMQAGPPGWGQTGCKVWQLAVGAKAYRTPEPRFSAAAFPWRSSFGQFALADGTLCWQRLEKHVAYLELKNQHGAIGAIAQQLLSIFEAVTARRLS